MWKMTNWQEFDKCKVIHALKQPKNLLCLLRKPKVQTCISEKYGLYRYECKDSPSVFYAHHVYKNVQVSKHQMDITGT